MKQTKRGHPEHTQVPILDKGEVIFCVDEKLQSLIQYLWDNDVVTFNSCQHNVKSTCWIEFDLADWIDITELAFRSQSIGLFNFIERQCEVTLLSSDDGQPDENDEYWIDGEELIWSASVRFKKHLLPEFERHVRSTLSEMRRIGSVAP